MAASDRLVLRADADAFAALRDETADILGSLPGVVEKDYWATEVLRAVATPLDGADLVVFKGGTSLSKAYEIIERFSEDIDLIVSTRLTGNGRKRLLRSVEAAVVLATGLNSAREREGNGFLNARISHESLSEVSFLKPGVLLEIGTRGGPSPCREMLIESQMAAHANVVTPGSRSDFVDLDAFSVNVLSPERTIAEKLAFLHHRASERDYVGLKLGARHLYDVARLLQHQPTLDALKAGFLAELMIDIDARSESAGWGFTPRPASGFADSPAFGNDAEIQNALRSGYRDMEPLIWGAVPAFENLIEVVHGHASII